MFLYICRIRAIIDKESGTKIHSQSPWKKKNSMLWCKNDYCVWFRWATNSQSVSRFTTHSEETCYCCETHHQHRAGSFLLGWWCWWQDDQWCSSRFSVTQTDLCYQGSSSSGRSTKGEIHRSSGCNSLTGHEAAKATSHRRIIKRQTVWSFVRLVVLNTRLELGRWRPGQQCHARVPLESPKANILDSATKTNRTAHARCEAMNLLTVQCFYSALVFLCTSQRTDKTPSHADVQTCRTHNHQCARFESKYI